MVRDLDRPVYRPVNFLDDEEALRLEVGRLHKALFDKELELWSARQDHARELSSAKQSHDMKLSSLESSRELDRFFTNFQWGLVVFSWVSTIALLIALSVKG